MWQLEGVCYSGLCELLGAQLFCAYCTYTICGISSFIASYCVYTQAKMHLSLSEHGIFSPLFLTESPEMKYTILPRSYYSLYSHYTLCSEYELGSMDGIAGWLFTAIFRVFILFRDVPGQKSHSVKPLTCWNMTDGDKHCLMVVCTVATLKQLADVSQESCSIRMSTSPKF